MRLINTQGFSLIEAMISLFLVALMLFGLDATQLYALKESDNLYFLSTALNQMNNGIERLIGLAHSNNSNNSDDLAHQLAAWNMENQSVLPVGFGTITGQYPNYIITVYWGNHPPHCQKQQIGSSGCLRKKLQLV